MAAWVERASEAWRDEEPAVETAAQPPVVQWTAALALAVVAGALLVIRLGTPAFFDNEGRYAEVAREMVLGGDWITPHLDFAVFLNKPPLLFWLTALVFRLGGFTEWARLVPVIAGVVALVATARLGALLYDEEAGLVACLALATSLGFVLEARTLRPDMVLVATVVVALLCWQRSCRGARHRVRWLVGLYTALGLGILDKGLVVAVIAGLPIGATLLHEHGWRGIRRLRLDIGLLVMTAIALPWHVAVALRNPGFAWDYVVNQHLLYFLGRKLPHDSTGDSLGFFWVAYCARAAPWVLLLPLTVTEAVRGAEPAARRPARGTLFLWVWTGGVLAFFSCASSRLEHYSLPALPATALLVARAWQRLRAGEVGRVGWSWLTVVGSVLVLAGAVGMMSGPKLLASRYWMAQAPPLGSLVVPAGMAAAVAGVLVIAGAMRRQTGTLVVGLLAGAIPLGVIVLRGEAVAEPLFSWRPAAQALAAAGPPGGEIVFEAPEEYQLVGGLAYYAGQRIGLLEPPGFVPPAYLAGRTTEMFLQRAEFERRWRSGAALALVSDPQRRRESPAGLVPEPFNVVGCFGDRWVLATPAFVAR